MKLTPIEREKRTVKLMISIYCKHNEGNKELCEQCKALIEYAFNRLERCKWGNDKKTCQHCPTHCYKPEMRQSIRKIMRFSGPRMIFYSPIESIRHLLKK